MEITAPGIVTSILDWTPKYIIFMTIEINSSVIELRDETKFYTVTLTFNCILITMNKINFFIWIFPVVFVNKYAEIECILTIILMDVLSLIYSVSVCRKFIFNWCRAHKETNSSLTMTIWFIKTFSSLAIRNDMSWFFWKWVAKIHDHCLNRKMFL